MWVALDLSVWKSAGEPLMTSFHASLLLMLELEQRRAVDLQTGDSLGPGSDLQLTSALRTFY